MVHRREITGTEVVFGNQGALWGNAMTWWDHDTGSVWSQPLGEAILGPRKGERLELLSSALTTWADWKELHPDTVALDAPDGRVGFNLDTLAIVVEIGPESLAVPVPELRQVDVVNETVNGEPVAVVLKPGTDQWHVFSRRIEGRTIELEFAGEELREVGGAATFDPTRGMSTAGGAGLDLLAGFTSFPRDYVTFFPDGGFWTTAGTIPATG